ncbi:hypothetical protein F0562_030472 [Nyssa sinensis]|uniref:Uncharacterized protein n=1 Tax=Nyssa sinensis TaxID=561372 RepID=A0A5J5AYN1_9ASTE|nr:hypothetical protein F0562_030472 [Nyssa sinensis]
MLRRTVKTEVTNSLFHDPTTPRSKSLKDNFFPDKDLADNKMIAVLEKSETMKPARKKINSTPMKVRRSSLMPMRSSAKSELSGLVEGRSVCLKSKSLINGLMEKLDKKKRVLRRRVNEAMESMSFPLLKKILKEFLRISIKPIGLAHPSESDTREDHLPQISPSISAKPSKPHSSPCSAVKYPYIVKNCRQL